MKMRMFAAIAAFSLLLQAIPAQADPHGPRHGPGSAGWGAPWPPHRPFPPHEVFVVYPPPPPPMVVVQSVPLSVNPVSAPYLDGQGRTCREYQTMVSVGGVSRPAYGTACLMADGTWRIVG